MAASADENLQRILDLQNQVTDLQNLINNLVPKLQHNLNNLVFQTTFTDIGVRLDTIESDIDNIKNLLGAS